MSSKSSHANHAPESNKLSGLTSNSVTILGALKAILGISCIIAPRFAGRLFLFDVPPEGVIMARLFGSSCAALGATTWALARRAGSDKGDLRGALIFNILADSVDVVSCVAAFETGMVNNGAFGLLGGGCVVFVVLGAVGLREL